VYEQSTSPEPAIIAVRQRRVAWWLDTLLAAGQPRSRSGVLGRLFGPILLGLGPSGRGGGGPDRDRTAETRNAADATGERVDGETIAELLVAQSVLTEDEGRDDLRLAETFRSDWRRRIGQVRDEERARLFLGMLIAVDPVEVTLEQRAERFVATREETEIGAWPSRAAFLADVALYPTLGEWVPQWTSLDGESRGELLARLRTFLERCPDCEGALRAEEAAGGDPGELAVSVACTDCEQVIVTGSY